MDFGNNIHYVMIIRLGLETHSYFSLYKCQTLIFSSFIPSHVSMMDVRDISPAGKSPTNH